MGIIVPDPEVMPEWAKKEGLSPDMKELCENKVTTMYRKNSCSFQVEKAPHIEVEYIMFVNMHPVCSCINVLLM